MNVRSPLVPPDAVVSDNLRVPSGAFGAMVTCAVADVLLVTSSASTVTPASVIARAVVPRTTKFVPVSVTVALVPWTADVGEIAVSVGSASGLDGESPQPASNTAGRAQRSTARTIEAERRMIRRSGE